MVDNKNWSMTIQVTLYYLLSGERLVIRLGGAHHLRVERDVDLLLLLELMLLLRRRNPITLKTIGVAAAAVLLLLLLSLHGPRIVAVTAIAE